MSIQWKPNEMPTLTSVLPGGKKLIDFARRVFDAKLERMYEGPGGAVAHAEIRDPMGPNAIPAGAVSVYVPDCDAAYKRALDAGAKSRQEPTDQFYGDRTARFTDTEGNQWSIATHIEDVSEAEMQRRMKKLMNKGG